MKKKLEVTASEQNPDCGSLTEEEAALCRKAQSGDEIAAETLIRRYEKLVKICVRPYYMMGADKEDLLQEGMIGLFKAIYRFQPDKGACFETFAKVCILRSAYSAVRAAGARGQQALNRSVSIEKPLFDDNACDYVSLSPDAADPEKLVIGREETTEFTEKLVRSLSPFEESVLRQYLQGKSYAAIAQEQGKPTKAVDNAIQRIRRKAADIFH